MQEAAAVWLVWPCCCSPLPNQPDISGECVHHSQRGPTLPALPRASQHTAGNRTLIIKIWFSLDLIYLPFDVRDLLSFLFHILFVVSCIACCIMLVLVSFFNGLREEKKEAKHTIICFQWSDHIEIYKMFDGGATVYKMIAPSDTPVLFSCDIKQLFGSVDYWLLCRVKHVF